MLARYFQNNISNSKIKHLNHAMIKVLLIAAYIIGFLLLFLPGAEFPLLVWMTLLPTTIALWFGPLGLLSKVRNQRWYDPATLFNTAMFYYVVKGVTLATGERPIFLKFLLFDTIASGYILVSLYVTVVLFAWNWAYRKILYRRGAYKSTNTVSKSFVVIRRPIPGVILLSLIGIACFFMLFHSISSNIFVFIASPMQRSYLTDGTMGLASPLANFWRFGISMFPAATMFWLAAIGSQNKRPNVFWWVHASINVGIIILIGGRADVISFVVSIIIIYHLLVNPMRPLAMVSFGVGAILYSYLVKVWRKVMGTVAAGSIEVGRSELGYALSLQGLNSFLSSTDLSDIRVFILISESYDRLLPFKYGASLIRIVTQFVPRILWPGKPLDLGLEVASLYNTKVFAGTPAGFFPEMYMNFHVVGVLLAGLLLGAVLAVLYRKWIVFGKDLSGIILYAVLAPRILLLPSSTLSNSIANLLPPLVGIIIAFSVSKTYSKSKIVAQ